MDEVHRFIENRQLKFALCGSSARKLRQAGVNRLAGRALSRTLYPFQPVEVDFLVIRNDQMVAVEAKSGGTGLEDR